MSGSRYLISLLAALGLLACGTDGGKRPVPKPEAMPRIEIPQFADTVVNAGGKELIFNSFFTVNEGEKPGWLTLTYPNFPQGALHITATVADDIDAAIENRLERMALNTGSLSRMQTQVDSHNGWDGLLMVSLESVTTPVQFLAVKGDSMLSGALYLTLPAGTAPDSVAPVVEAANRDMLHMLKRL